MSRARTVCLIDDDAAVCHALGLFLEGSGYQVKVYNSAEAFLAVVNDCEYGVAVLDQRMQGMSGMELHAELKRRGIEMEIIFITGHGDVQMSVRALKAGAADFLEKPFNNADLLKSINEAFLRARLKRKDTLHRNDLERRCESLTPREREVMELVVKGMSNRKLAERLGVSDRTIEVHRSRVMTKMGATSLPDLVRKVALCCGDEPLA